MSSTSSAKFKTRARVALLADRMLPAFRGKKRVLLAVLSGAGRSLVPIGGHRVELDLADPFEARAALRMYQADVIEVLRDNLRPGDCFADCGANIGVVSLHLVNHLGPKGQIYAFEPDPRIYARLEKNFAAVDGKGCKVTAVPSAVGAVEAMMEMHLSQQSGWSTLSRQATAVGRQLGAEIAQVAQVRVITLDSFFGSAERTPNVIKIDVEGWEHEVLQGAERLLRQSPPRCIVVERNEPVLKAMNREFSAVSGLLASHGYRVGAELADDVVFTRD